MPKSLLAPAKKSDYLYPAAVAFRPDNGQPVCGRCWSQLDYDWGKGRHPHVEHDQVSSNKGDPYVDEEGEEWMVYEDSYRCSNPLCDATVKVRTMPAKLSFSVPYHPEDLEQGTIDPSDPHWKEGQYNEWGQFVVWDEEEEEWMSITVDEDNEWAVIYEGVWAYIPIGKLDTPPYWTYDKGLIKVNVNSQRFKDIKKWFSKRGHRLKEPEE